MVRRNTARPDDAVFVSGTLGDAALGLLLRRNARLAAAWGLAAADTEHLRRRYLRPQPRLGDVEPAERDQALRAHQRGGEGQQPHRKARPALAAGELDGGSAQAKAAALGEESKEAADQEAAQP